MAVGPIGFHRVRGENIRITNDGRTATRVDSFNKALCFTNRPLKANEKLTFRIAQVTRAWSGTLRVGVTVHDPEVYSGCLPKYCCPDLNMKPGNWGKALEQSEAVENTKLQIYVTPIGNVMLKVNDQEPDVFLSGVQVNVPLYVLFDIYGNTQGVELLEVTSTRATVPRPETATAAIPRPNNAPVIRSEPFGVDLQPAQFASVNTANVRASATTASGLTGRPGGMAMTETALRAGQALIVRLQELHRGLPIALALSAVTTNEIREFESIEDLCDQTYSVLFKSSVATAGEEIAVVISEQGVVHVSHAGKKWLKCVHIDPNVEFRVVFDMQTIKKVSIVGITNQLQAPAEAAAEVGVSAGAKLYAKGGGDDGERSNTDCVICLESPRDTLLMPCMHFVLCSACARSLLQGPGRECPICRKVIQDSKKIFMS